MESVCGHLLEKRATIEYNNFIFVRKEQIIDAIICSKYLQQNSPLGPAKNFETTEGSELQKYF